MIGVVSRGSVSVLVAALVATALLAAPVTGAEAPGGAAAAAAVIDPNLAADVARQPAPAILSWDRDAASHHEVTAYLRRAGVDAHVFSALPAAVTCMATARDVEVLAEAPGALSVWGEEPLTPTLDQSRPTAFNGGEEHVHDELGLTGEGVGVAVVDTGVDGTHPDLTGKVVSNVRVLVSHREFMGQADPPPCQDVYAPETADTELTSGHGTHMATIAAGSGAASEGRFRGIAPDAHLVGVGVNDTLTPQATDPTRSVTISLLGAIAGFNHVLLYGLDAPVLTKVAIAGWVGDGLHDPFHPVYLAARDLWHFDIVVVFPTGNEGPEASDCSSAETCHFNPFAVGPFVVAAGATPKQSRDTLTSFSSRGDPVPRRSRGEEFTYQPTVVAPGADVVAARRAGTASLGTVPGSMVGAGGSPTSDQTRPHYVAMTGTSVAAAHVAGAVALIQQAAHRETGCFLSAAQVQDVLTSTATPLPGHEQWEAGAGALDITAAVTAARDHPRNSSPDPWVCL